MKLPRRRIFRLAAGLAAFPLASRIARALDYPERPVRIVFGFDSGGAGSILVRLLAQWLSERFGQSFVIENRPGAGGNVAAEAVVHSAPDGYTLLWVTTANAINATLYDDLNFNFIRDIIPVAGVTRTPQVMEVNPAFPAKTVPEFIAYAKSNPGQINFGSAGYGTSSHVAAELFKAMTGIAMVHVPYRGDGPALVDLIGGHVQVYFGLMPSSIGYIKAGKLRPLGVTTAAAADV